MSNLALASGVLDRLAASGVREIVLCGGSRNAPLVIAAVGREELAIHSFFEERSAAFFALGRARASGNPVAVITTSGTAVAELLPAAIEAHYSGVPLIFVTADRPARHRGTGSPQAIEQRGIFGVYAEGMADLEPGRAIDLPSWSYASPLHINTAFDEPLLEGELGARGNEAIPRNPSVMAAPDNAAARIREFLASSERPLLILGELATGDRSAVRDFALRLDAIVYAEPLSGLREETALGALLLRSGERIIEQHLPDAVLRIGGVPALRFWRDLDERHSAIPVLSISRLPFSGLARGEHLRCDPSDTLKRVAPQVRSSPGLPAIDRARSAVLDSLLDTHSSSEPSLIRAISRQIPSGSLLYLGNSLPIREWDLAAARDDRGLRIAANRGANGIDGQLSTFLGLAYGESEAWAIVGDLTALYDLSAPWALRNLPPGRIRIVVVNNGGGRIFARVPSLRAMEPARREVLFENAHELDFRGWAAMWDLEWHVWEGSPPAADRAIIELRPDSQQTARFWTELEATPEEG